MFEVERALVGEQAALQRQDQVAITRPGATNLVTDPDTLETTVQAQAAVWAGAAHCKPVSASGSATLGPGEQALRSMTVSIPPDAAAVYVDDVLTVVAAADPGVVDGSAWRVDGVSGSGFWGAFVSLSCVELFPSTYWIGGE